MLDSGLLGDASERRMMYRHRSGGSEAGRLVASFGKVVVEKDQDNEEFWASFQVIMSTIGTFSHLLSPQGQGTKKAGNKECIVLVTIHVFCLFRPRRER